MDLTKEQDRDDRILATIRRGALHFSLQYNLLCHAIENDKEEMINELLAHGCNVNNLGNFKSTTPLHMAILKNNMPLLKKLLQKGASATARDYNNCTPIRLALVRNNINALKLLLETVIDSSLEAASASFWNVRVKTERSLLHLAVERRNFSIAKLLLQKGANVDEVSYDGVSPIFLAAMKGYDQIFGLLLNFRAKIDLGIKIGGKSILHHAVDKISPFMVREILIKNYIKVNKFSDILRTAVLKPLDYFCCCRKICDQVVIGRLLSKHGFSFREDAIHDENLVFSVVTVGHMIILEDFLKKGLDANKAVKLDSRVCTLLELSVMFRQKNIAKLLLSGGAEVNFYSSNTKPLLFSAIENLWKECPSDCHNCCSHPKHDLELIEVLLKFGANVDCKDETGATPLHWVVSSEAQEKVRDAVPLLLRYGANPNCKDENGATVLHQACKKRNYKNVVHLIDYAANISAVDNKECTIFDYIEKGDNLTAPSTEFLSSPTELTKYLQDYVVKFKVANLYLSKHFTDLPTPFCKPKRQKCFQEQLTELKNAYVVDSSNSYYNILTATSSELVANLSSSAISKIITSCDSTFGAKCEDYIHIIESKLTKAKRRREFLDELEETYYRIFSFLPPNGVNEMLKFLNDQELSRIIFVSSIYKPKALEKVDSTFQLLKRRKMETESNS